MPGTGTLGKLFFKLFFERFGSQNSLQPKSKQTRRTPWKSSLYRLKASPSRACLRAPSRQENNPADPVATARRFRRAA